MVTRQTTLRVWIPITLTLKISFVTDSNNKRKRVFSYTVLYTAVLGHWRVASMLLWSHSMEFSVMDKLLRYSSTRLELFTHSHRDPDYYLTLELHKSKMPTLLIPPGQNQSLPFLN